MANYALVTGLDIYSVGPERFVGHHYKILGHAYSNTVEIHNFLHSIGYISIHMMESRVDLKKEIEAICNKLKDGDKFFLYYYGPAAYGPHDQYIFSPSGAIDRIVDIKWIEKQTAICGVERSILLDLYRQESVFSSDQPPGINRRVFEEVVKNASSNSPIGFYYNYNDTFPPEDESLLAKTVLSHFSSHAQHGFEISFPAIGESISDAFKKELSNIVSDDRKDAPCFIGDKVVVLHQSKANFRNSTHISKEQKREKDKVDQQLGQVLHEHEKWLSNGRPIDNCGRLTWQKLEPLFAIYEQYKLGPIELTNRKMDYADFTSARFPRGTRLSGSSLCNSLFDYTRFDSVDFSNCKMDKCTFESSAATQSNFSNSSFHNSEFGGSNFICCNFSEASMCSCFCEAATFDKSCFQSTDLGFSFLILCTARETNFTNAKLTHSVLNGTDFSGSILTGVRLYGSAHASWCIDEVECQYVFWDMYEEERFPPDNDFAEGEFSKQYRPYTMFSYTFKEGITPLDLMLATYIVDQINESDMGFKIKIDNASVRGLNPTLNFIMEAGDDKRADAQELFKQEYEKQIQKLKKELQKANEQLLAERGARANFAEKHLEISAKHQQITNQFFAPLLTELLQRKDSPNKKRLGHRESEQSNGKVQKVMLCDKSLTVQIGENEPVAFGSVKQYAVFKAVIQASKIQDQRVDLEQIAENAGEIESALTSAKEEKRPGWRVINGANEVSGICHDLREYCEKNGQLGFLMPLILQAYKKIVPLAGYEIEEVEFISDGRPISDY